MNDEQKISLIGSAITLVAGFVVVLVANLIF